MERRLARWRALGWRDRGRLLACMAGLGVVHGSLGLMGYARTRRVVESLSRHPRPRMAQAGEIEDAKALAQLAAVAGRHGPVQATCLRRSLLLYGWLRRRGLQPVLQLGVAERTGPFEAHAWIELEGIALLPIDAGHRPFTRPARPVADG